MTLYAHQADIQFRKFEKAGGFDRLAAIARQLPLHKRFLEQHFRQVKGVIKESRAAAHFLLSDCLVEESLSSVGKKGTPPPHLNHIMHYMRPEPTLGQDAFRPEATSLLMESAGMAFLRRPYPVLFPNFDRVHKAYLQKTGDIIRFQDDDFDRVVVLGTMLSFALERKWRVSPLQYDFEPVAIPFGRGLLVGRAYSRPVEELSYLAGSFVAAMVPQPMGLRHVARFSFNKNLSVEMKTGTVVSIKQYVASADMTENERALEGSARDLVRSLFTPAAESILSLRYQFGSVFPNVELLAPNMVEVSARRPCLPENIARERVSACRLEFDRMQEGVDRLVQGLDWELYGNEIRARIRAAEQGEPFTPRSNPF